MCVVTVLWTSQISYVRAFCRVVFVYKLSSESSERPSVAVIRRWNHIQALSILLHFNETSCQSPSIQYHDGQHGHRTSVYRIRVPNDRRDVGLAAFPAALAHFLVAPLFDLHVSKRLQRDMPKPRPLAWVIELLSSVTRQMFPFPFISVRPPNKWKVGPPWLRNSMKAACHNF